MRPLVDRPTRSLVLRGCVLALAMASANAQDTTYSSPTYFEGDSFSGVLAGDQFGSGCADGGCTNDGICSSNRCPEHKPCLEQVPGRSLYWQDICGSGYRQDEPLLHDSGRASFYASIESVALFRDQVSATAVVPTVPAGILNTSSSELETEFENSLRAVIGVALGDWYRLDFTWMGGYEWSDTLAASRSNESRSMRFQSSMNTAEINLRRRVRIRDLPQHYPDYHTGFEFSTLVGFRYLDLDEALSYEALSDLTTNVASVTTTNKMAGVQIGGLAQWLYEDRGWLDLEVKGAILSNDLTVGSNHANDQLPPDPNTAGPGLPASSSSVDFVDDQSRTSFLVDASLMFNYQFTPTLTFRLGYNMIWVSGAALASENISSNAAMPLLNANHDGESIFHGPSIGAVLTL